MKFSVDSNGWKTLLGDQWVALEKRGFLNLSTGNCYSVHDYSQAARNAKGTHDTFLEEQALLGQQAAGQKRARVEAEKTDDAMNADGEGTSSGSGAVAETGSQNQG